jgi:hypothetical protein
MNDQVAIEQLLMLAALSELPEITVLSSGEVMVAMGGLLMPYRLFCDFLILAISYGDLLRSNDMENELHVLWNRFGIPGLVEPRVSPTILCFDQVRAMVDGLNKEDQLKALAEIIDRLESNYAAQWYNMLHQKAESKAIF